MPFRFPLASVLRVRESIERREEIALKAAQLEVARVRRKIDEVTEEMTRICQEREQALRNTVSANRLQLMQMEIDAAGETRQALGEELRLLKHQLDAQMKAYRKARSGRQMLSDLLAQSKSAYEQQQARIEQKNLDDVVASRWSRTCFQARKYLRLVSVYCRLLLCVLRAACTNLNHCEWANIAQRIRQRLPGAQIFR